MSNIPTIQDWLRKERLKKNLSIRALARQSRISHTTLADIEMGIKPSLNVCKKLADYFGISQESVMRMAGLLDDPPKYGSSQLIDAIVHESGALSLDEQEGILEFIRFRKRLSLKNDTAPDRRGMPKPKRG